MAPDFDVGRIDYCPERGHHRNLEGDPDFDLIRMRMRSTVDAQRSHIRLLLTQNDMEQLLAPLADAEVIDE